MDEITLNISSAGLEEALERLRHLGDKAEDALIRALNTAGSAVRSSIPKEIVKAFDVNKDIVGKRIYISRAKQGDLSVTVGRRGKRWLAKRFNRDPNTMPRQRGGSPVYLRPRRDGTGGKSLDAHHPTGAEHPVSKAFIAHLPNRGRGIYARIGHYRDRLAVAKGLSVPEMLNEPDVRSAVERSAEYALQVAVDKEIQKLLSESQKNRGNNI